MMTPEYSVTEDGLRALRVDEVLKMLEVGILGEDEPVELLDGRLVHMPPQGPPHATRVSALARRLMKVYEPGNYVREEKPIIADPTSMPEPDVAVARGELEDYTDRHPAGADTVLVAEIARTSQSSDRAKAAIYARAGVPVYWLLDLPARRLEVHEDLATDGRYRLTRMLVPGDTVKLPETDVEWAVSSLFPPE